MDTPSISHSYLHLSANTSRYGIADVHLLDKTHIVAMMLVRILEEIDLLIFGWRTYWIPYLQDHASVKTVYLALAAIRWGTLAIAALLGWTSCATWYAATTDDKHYTITISAPELLTDGVVHTPAKNPAVTEFFQQRLNYQKNRQQDERLAAIERQKNGQAR